MLIFVGPGGFADEHQLGASIANSKNDLLASLFVQAAAGTVPEVLANDFKSLHWVGGAGFGFGDAGFEDVFFYLGQDCFGSGGHWLSLAGIDFGFRRSCDRARGRTFATVEVIDAEFTVVADALGEGTAELRVEGHEPIQRITAGDQ